MLQESIYIQTYLLTTSSPHNSLGSHAYYSASLSSQMNYPASLSSLNLSNHFLSNFFSRLLIPVLPSSQTISCSLLLLSAQFHCSPADISFIHPPAFSSHSLSLSVVPKPLFPSFHLKKSKVHWYLCIAVLQKSKLLVGRQYHCGCLVFILSTPKEHIKHWRNVQNKY